MTKKIMFLLTASILSLGIMTGCSGNSGNTQSDDGNNAVSQADTQSVSDNSADDATGSSVNTVVGSGITDDNGDSAGTTAASTQASNSNDGYITEEEASSIALAEVDGATADELRIYKIPMTTETFTKVPSITTTSNTISRLTLRPAISLTGAVKKMTTTGITPKTTATAISFPRKKPKISL